ncbi:MAG: FapA family protein [Treponema sp.]|jgi:uncharacterized protein (DUF342 family)|nr:FapA family protein [Treponema sp.]
MKERLEQDKAIQKVTVTGATLEEAVAQAAAMLDLPIRQLEYEVTEKGSPGFFGSGKKDWVLHAYKKTVVKRNLADENVGEEKVEDSAPVIEDKDGDLFVHLSYDGVFLKVVPPEGRGKKVDTHSALRALQDRSMIDIDENLVARVVRGASGEYVRIGDFEHWPINDSMVAVEISEGEMKAFITVTPPGTGGCDISMETYLSFLRNNRVVYGVNEAFLKEFADRPVYREKIMVAEGINPINGQDSYIQYNFETDQTKLKLRQGSNGRIDFKDLNIIKNVVENQPLAWKIPPEAGVSGRTVTGKVLPAKNGKDSPVPLGKNVHLSDDGTIVIADINGQVVLSDGKINVEPVYTVQGDVNLKTGNIIFLGTVIINGNVEDGFSVKAAGNIEVNGMVEKAELDAEGDIIVHQGIIGKNSGFLRAGSSIWARFIENAVIESGNMVVVSDGIINSQVDAYKSIVCQGKRAQIVGGRLRASEKISAKILGSPTGGTETICEVGIDPKSKMQLEKLLADKEDAEKQFEDIHLNLQTLINIRKQRNSLPEDKEIYMRELMGKRRLLDSNLQKINEDINKIQEFLNTIKTVGRVSASSKVYPGVKILIKDAVNEIRTEYKAVTFVLENGLVRVAGYDESDDEEIRVPDGYPAD